MLQRIKTQLDFPLPKPKRDSSVTDYSALMFLSDCTIEERLRRTEEEYGSIL